MRVATSITNTSPESSRPGNPQFLHDERIINEFILVHSKYLIVPSRATVPGPLPPGFREWPRIDDLDLRVFYIHASCPYDGQPQGFRLDARGSR